MDKKIIALEVKLIGIDKVPPRAASALIESFDVALRNTCNIMPREMDYSLYFTAARKGCFVLSFDLIVQSVQMSLGAAESFLENYDSLLDAVIGIVGIVFAVGIGERSLTDTKKKDTDKDEEQAVSSIIKAEPSILEKIELACRECKQHGMSIQKITIETKLNDPSQSTEQAADSDKVSAEKAEAMKPLPINSKKPPRVRLHARQNNKHDRKVLDFNSSDEFPTEIIVKSSGKIIRYLPENKVANTQRRRRRRSKYRNNKLGRM